MNHNYDVLRRNTIADAFLRVTVKYRDREALAFGDRCWTFGDLLNASMRVGRDLFDSGLRKGDRVVAFGRNSDAYLLAWLGCTFSGLVHVPANYALTATELRYIVSQSQARALLYDPDLASVVSAAALPGQLDVSKTLRGGAPQSDILARALCADAGSTQFDPPTDEALAQILYTSGTTAAPKGAMLTHRALLAEYVSCTIGLDFVPEDRVLAALPLYHAAQMHTFTMPQLLVGASTVLMESANLDSCLRLIQDHRITSFFAPPTVWIGLLRHQDFDRYNLTSLQKIYYGASIMPVPVLRELLERLPGAGAYNCYGQSEIGPLATVLRPEEHLERPASAGRPVYNVITRIVDETMNDVPPGTHGEIVHRSPQLLTGYWDKQAETDEAFRGGWFHSGDVGYFDDEGFLFVVDRLKDVIKTGGIVVSGREVEEVLFAHPAVSEVAVVGLPHEKWIEIVVATVVTRQGAEIDAATLIAHARLTLAPFKVPKRIIFVDSLPKNTAGKVLKRELRHSLATIDAGDAGDST